MHRVIFIGYAFAYILILHSGYDALCYYRILDWTYIYSRESVHYTYKRNVCGLIREWEILYYLICSDSVKYVSYDTKSLFLWDMLCPIFILHSGYDALVIT
jgi:hypothetical protein